MSKPALEEPNVSPHFLHLSERNALDVHGVTEITYFDEEQVQFKTTQGNLHISGKSLCVKSLLPEKAAAHVEGEIHALSYSKGKSSRPHLLSSLFR